MNYFISIFALVSLFSIANATEVFTAEGPPLKLKKAVENALHNNPALKESREREVEVQTTVPAARSTLFPTLTGTISGSQSKDAANSGAPRFGGNKFNSYGSSLKLNQVLLQVGVLSAINAAQKDVQISQFNTSINKRDLIADVTQAYFQVVLYSRNVETLLAQQKIAKETVVTAQHRQSIGRGLALEVLQAKTQLALLEGQLESANNLLQESTASLVNLLGNSTAESLLLENKMEAPEISAVDKIIDLQSYKVPEIEREELLINKVDDQKRILWGQNLPSLSLFGNYNFSNFVQSDLYNDNGASWSVGLQLTIPLFSGFSSVYQQRALDSKKSQYYLNKVSLINQISYQQVTSRKRLETAFTSIKTGQEALKYAESAVKEARRNFNLSNIDFSQFLPVQQAHVQAHVQAQQALNQYKYNYIVALTIYFAASGQDMEKLVDLLEQVNL